jgi:hypothetical protein
MPSAWQPAADRIGANLYAEDWEQQIPRGSAGEAAWYMLFMPFLAQKPVGNDYRTVEIYRCPSYPDKDQTVCFVINGWDFKDRNDRTGQEIRTRPGCDVYAPGRTLCLDNENGPGEP